MGDANPTSIGFSTLFGKSCARVFLPMIDDGFCHAGEDNDDDSLLDEPRKRNSRRVFDESSRMEKEMRRG